MRKLVTLAAAVSMTLTLAVPAVDAAATPSPSTASTTQTGLRSQVEAYLASAKLPAATAAKARALAAKLPAGLVLKPRARMSSAVGSEWVDARNSAIDPSQYECGDTAVDAWFDTVMAGVDRPNLQLLNRLGGLDLPSYLAMIFGKESRANVFGLDGSYTNELTRTMRDLKSFWDIRSGDIELMPMHGAASFTNQALVSQTLQLVYGVDAETGDAIAGIYPILLAADPLLKGGDHPIFTFNAFAYTAEGDPEAEALGISDRIVMGDGVLAGMKAIGLNRTAPRSILSHEFGHHIQFEDNLFDSPLTGPEATRRTELMADSYGSYFMTHKKGQAINKHLVLQDAQSFYNVGDCAFTSDGHHGTPNQRLRAAQWGADVAQASKPASFVLPSLDFAAKFDRQLPQLVAPDAR